MEMAARVKDICSLLEETAPRRLAEKWDNVGLQVGSLGGEIKKIMFSLDPCIEAVNFACSSGAQLLVTHHPLIFSPLISVHTDSFPGGVVALALEKKISLFSSHTNLDRAKSGINDALAEILELEDAEVLEDFEGGEGEGLGRIGGLKESLSLSAFAERVAQRLSAESLRIVGSEETCVKRVAVVGGSGAGFALRARAMGADVLVTGDVGYHHALEASREGLCVIDAGHFYTEKAAFRMLAQRFQITVNSKGWEIEVGFYDGQRSPLFNLSTGGEKRSG